MNWEAFLEDHTIHWVDRGPNTKRGELSIQCPWCGDADPSQHLGISLATENWGCHRDAEHRGRSAHRLIAALLGCSYNQARLIEKQYNRADPDTLEEALAVLTDTPLVQKQEVEKPKLLPEFREIQKIGSTAKFWRYLERRGFDNIQDLCWDYSLMCCLTGRWKDRIIIPVLMDGELVGWTGRAIVHPRNAPRYLTSSPSIKTTVLNADTLSGGNTLLVTEGPFDALKLDYYGWSHGLRAVCVFGTSLSIDQVAILRRMKKHFKKCLVMFDPEATGPAFQASDWLDGAEQLSLPDGIEDPGAMTKKEVLKLVRALN